MLRIYASLQQGYRMMILLMVMVITMMMMVVMVVVKEISRIIYLACAKIAVRIPRFDDTSQ